VPVGTELRVVKLSPEGREATSYTGVVQHLHAPPPWLAVRADWVRDEIELDGLRFVPGDTLHEFFSPIHGFNVFSVWSPEHTLRGWYANVTYPSWIDGEQRPPALYWHDLYLDLIALPGGQPVIRDEEELQLAGLREAEPELHDWILDRREEMLTLYRGRKFPFHE